MVELVERVRVGLERVKSSADITDPFSDKGTQILSSPDGRNRLTASMKRPASDA